MSHASLLETLSGHCLDMVNRGHYWEAGPEQSFAASGGASGWMSHWLWVSGCVGEWLCGQVLRNSSCMLCPVLRDGNKTLWGLGCFFFGMALWSFPHVDMDSGKKGVPGVQKNADLNFQILIGFSNPHSFGPRRSLLPTFSSLGHWRKTPCIGGQNRSPVCWQHRGTKCCQLHLILKLSISMRPQYWAHTRRITYFHLPVTEEIFEENSIKR